MIKRVVKKLLMGNSRSSVFYEALRARYHRLRKLGYFYADARHVHDHMRWETGQQARYAALSAEIIFQFHKLEKGLCMPGQRRFFGYDPAIATMNLLERWRHSGFAIDDPVYLGAIGALLAYRQRLDELGVTDKPLLLKRLDELLLEGADPLYVTPVPKAQIREEAWASFSGLMQQRRSVRDFSQTLVSRTDLEAAIATAQLSPSACNRQPCRVHVFQDKAWIDRLLAFQNGNRGFGQVVHNLLIVTAESGAFFDASERHQAFVDGGLFVMSLLLALESRGVSSCCLNWCVDPATDVRAHEAAGIDEAERIIMYIAIGHAETGVPVPLSARRRLQNIVHWH